MKNPRKTKSYQAILQRATSLFWKHGVRRVTVEEICREAEISKMTFYRLFNNKNEVAEQVLDGVLEGSMMRYKSIMRQPVPFSEKIKQIMLLKQDTTTGISEEFIRDIYQHEDSGLKQRMEDYRKRMMEEVIEDFRIAQQNGWIRKDLKPEFIMYAMEQFSAMILDEKLIAMYKNSQDIIMEITNFFFYGILSYEAPVK